MTRALPLAIAFFLLAGCASLNDQQKDRLTLAAIVATGFVLVNNGGGSGSVMCDNNPHTLQPPCVP